MAIAKLDGGTPTEVTGAVTLNDGSRISYESVANVWSETDRNEVGIYTIQEPGIPEGYTATGSSLQWGGTAVSRVYTLEPITS